MPALITPLNDDQTVKTDVVGKLISSLIDKGADGFYIGGATGEGINLRCEERMKLAEAAVSAIDKRVSSIVQVAAYDFADAVRLAKHAEAIGADAISATTPLFFPYSEDDIYNYYKALADAVHIPMMIYYNPAAGFQITANFAARMFEVDNITAIKWTSSNYYEMIRLKDLTRGEMNIINGPDEMLLCGLVSGADGGIGSTYNYQLENIKEIYNRFRAGDIEGARAAQTRADRIIYAMLSHGNIPPTKVILEAMGFDVGCATFPARRYTDEQKARILADMRAAGLEI